MALKQNLQLKLQQKLSPQQIQLMKLLQVPTAAIEQKIKEELEDNPALEESSDEVNISEDEEYSDVYDEVGEAEQEFDFSDYVDDDDIPDYKLYNQNRGVDEEVKSIPLAMGVSFVETLTDQFHLQNLTDKQRQIGDMIIGNLDESGYLRREIDALVDDLAFTANIMAEPEEIEEVLKKIQELDPPGVGARDLRECLLIQLHRKEDRDEIIETAIQIITKSFDEFSKKHYNKILSRFDISEDLLRESIDEIKSLNPKPGNTGATSGASASTIVPDFILSVSDSKLNVTLNGRNAPELKVSKKYGDMISDLKKGAKPSKETKDALVFIKQKLDSAKWFIDAIKQRQQTLMITMEAIADYQREFFLSGDESKIKPMILKDIAEKIAMDISTVSRVANSKYVLTPYGTLPLKFFFSESLTTQSGEEVSSREIKHILKTLIDAENKRTPLTDEKLGLLLEEKGYNIARRTVAKYREQLNIPVARLRKQL